MISIFILLLSLVGIAVSSSDQCSMVKEIWNVIFQKDWVESVESCCDMVPLVTCGNGNVTGIDWTGRHLKGPIPGLFGKLVSLKSLILSANKLSGEIPAELADLKELEFLDLGYNNLTGFGHSLGLMTSLTGVNLAFNKMSESIPEDIGNISSLKGLWVEHNQIKGEVPRSLTVNLNLNIADLSKNPELHGLMGMRNGLLHISGTGVNPCTEESTDDICLEINAKFRSNDNSTIQNLVESNETAVEVSMETNPTNETKSENYLVAGGIVGGGMVATTLLLIFRTPKTSKSQMDDGPDLETVTEGNFPDISDLPEITEGGVLSEPGTGNFKEEGPSAADIDAVFPSIFSTIMGDLRKD